MAPFSLGWISRRFLLASVIAWGVGPLCAYGEDPPSAEGVEFFEKKIRPILVEHCQSCHSSKKQKGELSLSSRKDFLKGGESGPIVTSGDPEKSRMIEAVRYQKVELQMPPKGKLSPQMIDDLTAWVKMGAPWPLSAGEDVESGPGKGGGGIPKRKKEHWAWQPVKVPALPAVRQEAWATQPIDRFILAKLEEKGLAPAPVADKRSLIRRITLDITGLPPTIKEIDDFLNDRSPQAFNKVVDRLLASPQFGERWARHWLDLARYAESRGHEFDATIPNAYQYRDYVIRAINADVPYNQFVTEQIAGDLMPKPRINPEQGFNESILGTGFWFLGEEVHSPVDIRADETDRFDNRIDVLTKTFLGLTVSCARCHDHKFDAISAKDYYALSGFLQSSNYRLVRFDGWDVNRNVAADLTKLREMALPALRKEFAELYQPSIRTIAPYLTAARKLLAETKEAELPASIRSTAEKQNLNPERLQAWVAYLKKAPSQAGDLFAPAAKAAPAVAPLHTVIDYANSSQADWLPDDITYGNRPQKVGEIRWSSDSKNLIDGFVEEPAAEFDSFWKGLTLTPGAQQDTGALNYARAGRTIRTPSFELQNGKVFYRVRGHGRVYAAVDSHILIVGPLHGRIVSNFDTRGQYQWVGMDLTPYQGHRIHLEFTPIDDGPFAVSQVVQNNAPSANPGSESLSDLTPEKVQEQFEKFADALTKNEFPQGPAGKLAARMGNWLLAHPELVPAAAATPELLAKPKKFHDELRLLQSKARKDSRLAMAIQDGSAENDRVLIRGSHKSPGVVAPRRSLEAFVGDKEIDSPSGSGRLRLAEQMTDLKTHPLIGRVIVNRVWHHLMGRGIVGSTDNFGVLGELPTHPELLDFMADRFVQEGWSIKNLIRSIALSSTYQMASEGDPKAEAADPENRLWHRARLRRLQGEAIRDSILALSGRLDLKMYGPSVALHLNEFLDGRGRPASGPLDGDGRRSLYIATRRNFLSPMMLAFDTPSPFSTVGRRTVSNVPAQALIMMNDPFVHQQAALWGKKVATSPGTPKEKVASMYLSAFARLPLPAEATECEEYVQKRGNTPEAFTDLAHVLFNVKEFIFVR